jgi:hypothetical protein
MIISLLLYFLISEYGSISNQGFFCTSVCHSTQMMLSRKSANMFFYNVLAIINSNLAKKILLTLALVLELYFLRCLLQCSRFHLHSGLINFRCSEFIKHSRNSNCSHNNHASDSNKHRAYTWTVTTSVANTNKAGPSLALSGKFLT